MVTIMNRTTSQATPISYSKLCDTFRPRRATARRTELGGKPFVNFLVHTAAPNGFIAKHVSEAGPARVKNGLRHAGFGEAGGVHVAHRNIVELVDDPAGRLVKVIPTSVVDLGVDLGGKAFLPCPLGFCELPGERRQVARIDDLLASGKGRKVLQAEVDAYRRSQRGWSDVGNFHNDVQIPSPARVLGKTASVLNCRSVRDLARIEDAINAARAAEIVTHRPYLVRAQRNPAKSVPPAIAKIRAAMLNSGPGVLAANRIYGVRLQAKVAAGSGRQAVQIKVGQPLLAPLRRVSLGIITVIPDEIDRACHAIQFAVQVFYAVAVGQNHAEILAVLARQDQVQALRTALAPFDGKDGE